MDQSSEDLQKNSEEDNHRHFGSSSDGSHEQVSPDEAIGEPGSQISVRPETRREDEGMWEKANELFPGVVKDLEEAKTYKDLYDAIGEINHTSDDPAIELTQQVELVLGFLREQAGVILQNRSLSTEEEVSKSQTEERSNEPRENSSIPEAVETSPHDGKGSGHNDLARAIRDGYEEINEEQNLQYAEDDFVKDAEQVYEDASPEEKEKISWGSHNFGFKVEQKKNQALAKIFKGTLGKIGKNREQKDDTYLTKWLEEFGDKFESRAADMQQKIENVEEFYKEGDKPDWKQRSGNWLYVLGNVGKVVGFATGSVRRVLLASGMISAAGFGAAKEARLKPKSEEDLKKTTLEFEEAQDEALKLYEMAERRAREGNPVSKEDIERAFVERIPGNIADLFLEEKKDLNSSFIGRIAENHLDIQMSILANKIYKIREDHSLDTEEQDKKIDSLLDSFGRSQTLKDYDRMLSRAGEIDTWAYAARNMEKMSRLVVMGTAAFSLTDLVSDAISTLAGSGEVVEGLTDGQDFKSASPASPNATGSSQGGTQGLGADLEEGVDTTSTKPEHGTEDFPPRPEIDLNEHQTEVVLEDVQLRTEMPAEVVASIKEEGNLWSAAQEMIESGEMSPDDFEEAWQASQVVDRSGQSLPVHEADLVYPGDQLKLVNTDEGPRFELVDEQGEKLEVTSQDLSGGDGLSAETSTPDEDSERLRKLREELGTMEKLESRDLESAPVDVGVPGNREELLSGSLAEASDRHQKLYVNYKENWLEALRDVYDEERYAKVGEGQERVGMSQYSDQKQEALRRFYREINQELSEFNDAKSGEGEITPEDVRRMYLTEDKLKDSARKYISEKYGLIGDYDVGTNEDLLTSATDNKATLQPQEEAIAGTDPQETTNGVNIGFSESELLHSENADNWIQSVYLEKARALENDSIDEMTKWQLNKVGVSKNDLMELSEQQDLVAHLEEVKEKDIRKWAMLTKILLEDVQAHENQVEGDLSNTAKTLKAYLENESTSLSDKNFSKIISDLDGEYNEEKGISAVADQPINNSENLNMPEEVESTNNESDIEVEETESNEEKAIEDKTADMLDEKEDIDAEIKPEATPQTDLTSDNEIAAKTIKQNLSGDNEVREFLHMNIFSGIEADLVQDHLNNVSNATDKYGDLSLSEIDDVLTNFSNLLEKPGADAAQVLDEFDDLSDEEKRVFRAVLDSFYNRKFNEIDALDHKTADLLGDLYNYVWNRTNTLVPGVENMTK